MGQVLEQESRGLGPALALNLGQVSYTLSVVVPPMK